MGRDLRGRVWVFASCLAGVAAVGTAAWAAPGGQTTPGDSPGPSGAVAASDTPSLLLIDESVVPGVTVRWRRAGIIVEHAAASAFGAPAPQTRLEGTNIAVFAALGGTRLEMGAGHPAGAILRLGLGKVDPARAFFAGIDPGSEVEILLRGARFNQAVRAEAATALVRLQYSLDDIEACALPPDAAVCFLTGAKGDTLGGLLSPGVNLRDGELDDGVGRGSAEAWTEADGTVTYRVVLPYGVLRHLQDPWASELPGTFFEPLLLQAEVEVLPVNAPARVIRQDEPALD